MNKDKFALIDIAKAGANLTIDGSKFSKFDLIDIAHAMQDGCGLEIQNNDDLSKYDMIDIAKSVAAGVITFS